MTRRTAVEKSPAETGAALFWFPDAGWLLVAAVFCPLLEADVVLVEVFCPVVDAGADALFVDVVWPLLDVEADDEVLLADCPLVDVVDELEEGALWFWLVWAVSHAVATSISAIVKRTMRTFRHGVVELL